MDPSRAARVLAETLLGREPNAAELAWVERVIRSVLPRTDEDDTRRVRTNQNWPKVDK